MPTEKDFIRVTYKTSLGKHRNITIRNAKHDLSTPLLTLYCNRIASSGALSGENGILTGVHRCVEVTEKKEALIEAS